MVEKRFVDVMVSRGVAGPALAGLVLLTAAAGSAAGWVDWPALGRWLAPHGGLLVMSAVGGWLLGSALGRALRRTPGQPPASALSWWVVAAAAVVVAGVAWGSTGWLLREAGQSQDPAAARVEAIKTGLSVAVGTGGVFALLLAARRQRHQELTGMATVLDAAEKRVTELYTKAADQLGSDKAPVRLAGIYALERVAQNNPSQRQTIVNVLCAYLRMPYMPPGEKPDHGVDPAQLAEHREQVQEREVRLTAQRLLTDHLRPGYGKIPAARFWDDVDLDLAGATLINFVLRRCTACSANFTGAKFIGSADFEAATFTVIGDFEAATFTGNADFGSATFIGSAEFGSATFAGDANFMAATFASGAYFGSAVFADGANFLTARFVGGADFGSATFTGRTDFWQARFLNEPPTNVMRFMRP